MQKLDAIVAATGAVVLVVAIAGAALYGGTAGTETFQITFASVEKTLPPAGGTASGQGFAETFTVTDGNVTSVKVTVVFTGAAVRAAAAPVVVEVTGPGGLAGQAEGSLGQNAATATVEVPLTVASKPADHAFEAGSIEAAEDHGRGFATTNGTGAWTVTVRATPTLPPGEAVTAEISFAYTVYTVAVTRDLGVPLR